MARFKKGNKVWWIGTPDAKNPAHMLAARVKSGVITGITTYEADGYDVLKSFDIYDVWLDEPFGIDVKLPDDDHVFGSLEELLNYWGEAMKNMAIMHVLKSLTDRVAELERKVNVLEKWE